LIDLHDIFSALSLLNTIHFSSLLQLGGHLSMEEDSEQNKFIVRSVETGRVRNYI
jgi:hypothetical protein